MHFLDDQDGVDPEENGDVDEYEDKGDGDIVKNGADEKGDMWTIFSKEGILDILNKRCTWRGWNWNTGRVCLKGERKWKTKANW